MGFAWKILLTKVSLSYPWKGAITVGLLQACSLAFFSIELIFGSPESRNFYSDFVDIYSKLPAFLFYLLPMLHVDYFFHTQINPFIFLIVFTFWIFLGYLGGLGYGRMLNRNFVLRWVVAVLPIFLGFVYFFTLEHYKLFVSIWT